MLGMATRTHLGGATCEADFESQGLVSEWGTVCAWDL